MSPLARDSRWGVGEVGAERGLGVRPGRHDAQRGPAHLLAVAWEGGDGLVPHVFERLGRRPE
jgi:hypothetical protein